MNSGPGTYTLHTGQALRPSLLQFPDPERKIHVLILCITLFEGAVYVTQSKKPVHFDASPKLLALSKNPHSKDKECPWKFTVMSYEGPKNEY